MSEMNKIALTVTFLGSGDAFGCGGRLQPSVHVDDGFAPFLIDCGATALLAMKRSGLQAERVETILISHLHGDHFCGIPFILRETQILAQRSCPLTVIGPAGIKDRIHTVMTSLFPGSWDRGFPFGLSFVEPEPLRPCTLGGLTVTLFPAVHSPGTNPHSLRVEAGSKVIAYSGDTQWNPHLIDACDHADLFICEAFAFEGPVKNHMDYRTLLKNRGLLGASRIVLTHMSESMLARLTDVEMECAHDGMTLSL